MKKRQSSTLLSQVAIVMLTNPGGIAMVITPAVLNAFVAEGRLTSLQAATLGPSELVAMSIALVAVSMSIARLDRRWMAAAGILAAVVGNLLSMFAPVFALVLSSRLLVGLGEGTLTALAVASIAGTKSPDRVLGAAVTSNLIVSAIFFYIASRIDPASGIKPVLSIIVAIEIICGLMVPFFPRQSSTAPKQLSVQQSGNAGSMVPAILGLTAMLLFLAGVGSVWPFVGIIGITQGIDAQVVASALARAGIAGILGGACVSWLGNRWGRLGPLIVGSTVIGAAMLLLLKLSSPGLYVANLCVFMFCWILSIPFYMGVLAKMDVSGRLVGLSVAMQTGGIAVGQALSASLMGERKLYSLGITIAAALVLSGAAAAWLAVRSAAPTMKDAHP